MGFGECQGAWLGVDNLNKEPGKGPFRKQHLKTTRGRAGGSHGNNWEKTILGKKTAHEKGLEEAHAEHAQS